MVRPVHVLAFGVMASLAAASVVRAASLPNLIVLLVDDLGESGIMANNPYIKGPRVSELKDEGVYLSRHYVYKVLPRRRGFPCPSSWYRRCPLSVAGP